MTSTTCPNCGFDLERVEDLCVGELTIVAGGAEVRWRGERVHLSTSRRLMVCAIARADGAMVSVIGLAEAIGYEGDEIKVLLDVNICYIRKAFRQIDPTFDRIERDRGRHSGGGARWRVDARCLARE